MKVMEEWRSGIKGLHHYMGYRNVGLERSREEEVGCF